MKTIGLFFGGLSNEAEVSIVSAQNVAQNFDYKKYKLTLIYWHKKDACFYEVEDFNLQKKKKKTLEQLAQMIDIALLMTHGRYGEDGVLQSLLESKKIKYCGCRVLSSAVCMDKAMFKKVLETTDICQVKYKTLDYKIDDQKEIDKIKKEVKRSFKLPWYVKPANSGSSVGITKVEKREELEQAIKVALKHDSKIVIEEGLVKAKEVEVAVLGNNKLLVSKPGELRLIKDFYSYDDKYKLGQTEMIIPATLTKAQTKKIQEIAGRAYKLYNCQGFARIDFLVSKEKIYLNEINTLPGFTDISMYPMLMMNMGMSYKELINKIISLAY